MTPSDHLLCQEISASLVQPTSEKLHLTVNENLHRDPQVASVQRVDFRALSPKWNVFFNPLSSEPRNYAEEEAERL